MPTPSGRQRKAHLSIDAELCNPNRVIPLDGSLNRALERVSASLNSD